MYVFTDCRLSQTATEALTSFGHTVIPCPPHPALDPAIASHPDMLAFTTENGIFVHAEHNFCAVDLPLIPIACAPARKYPHDVLLNAAQIGSYLVCRPDAVAKELLLYAARNGLTLLPIRQGYAKCNLCVVSDHAAVTEDASIACALRSARFEVLQINPGGVSLAPYDYGFIGGASGNDGTHVFFYGDLSLHPDGVRIADFCKKHGKIPVSLAPHALTDVGSLLFYDKK